MVFIQPDHSTVLEVTDPGPNWVKMPSPADNLAVFLEPLEHAAPSSVVFTFYYPTSTNASEMKLRLERGTPIAEARLSRIARSESGWSSLETQISAWADLKDDWDDEGAPSPAVGTIENARSFIGRARRAATPVPEIYIDAEGEIGFTWKKLGRYASAAFPQDGHFVGYCDVGSGSKIERLDEPYSSNLDLDVFFTKLRRLY